MGWVQFRNLRGNDEIQESWIAFKHLLAKCSQTESPYNFEYGEKYFDAKENNKTKNFSVLEELCDNHNILKYF